MEGFLPPGWCIASENYAVSEYILETKKLSFQYTDGIKALKNINLQIEKGKK